ncbi:MAG TPA: GspMb/PilO family protein [Opitutaceae bacterium]|nr:GspMb/PilO family protein [Opitutaceae bacterium]
MSQRILVRLWQLALRYPFGAAGFVLSLLLAGVSIWLHFDARELEVQQLKRARDGDNMLKFIARGSQLRTELATVHAAAQRITESLVVEKNIPENFWYFYKIEQDTQVKLTELQQRPAPLQDAGTPGTYKRVPYSLKLTGPFRAVVAYLQRLESGSRFGRVNSFQLQRQDPAASNVILQLDLELLGFP